MKLDRHIAYRFLTDDSLAWEITYHMHPQVRNLKPEDAVDGSPILVKAAETYQLVNKKNQKAYYITNTVIDKLDMLKINKNKELPVKVTDKEEFYPGVMTYDWSVFLPRFKENFSKFTFIMPDNKILRLQYSNGYLSFCFINCETFDFDKNHTDLRWVMFWVNARQGYVCEHWKHIDVQRVEEFIYKLLCFIYLSENTEQVVPPGGKHGTQKSGKIINSMKIPVTVVTSKWNVTSIRTEGFEVSGHFRLQPYKTGARMIFIQPYQKHGYVKRAKSESQ